MPEQLDYRGYPTHPRHLKDGAWYYEQAKGIYLLIDGQDGKTVQTLIPWRKIVAAVGHHYNARRMKNGLRTRS